VLSLEIGVKIMFEINSDIDRPDINYMKNVITDLVSKRGIKVKNISTLTTEIKGQMEEYDKEILHLTGIANPRSSKQVKEYFGSLTDEDTLKHCTNELGEVLTDVNALTPLAELGRQDAILILKSRKLQAKLNSIKQLNPDNNGIIRPQVDLLLSNRISYSKPNLMGIAKEILWDVVVPIQQDSSLWSVDIKNQEPHIIAYYLGIPELQRMIESGKGVYESLFAEIFPDEELTESKRSELKTVWNALTYGGSFNSFRNKMQIDAKKVHNYFKSLKGMKEHKENCRKIATSGKNKTVTYFGTEVTSDKVGKQLERSLMDLAIQGTGADILALLIEHFYDWKDENDIDSLIELYYTRHDELIFEVSNSLSDEDVCNILSTLFTHKVDNWKAFDIKIKKVSKP
jgi:DNA polymerase I-like protein with 3'-5' exonuclease and polymerase domains